MKKIVFTLLLIGLIAAAAIQTPVFADEPVDLITPPLMPEEPVDWDNNIKIASEPSISFDVKFQVYLPMLTNASSQAALDPNNKQSVLNFYNTNYANGDFPDIEWTGDMNSCNPGTTSEDFRESIENRINFYREMAGVPPTISLYDLYIQNAQAAALVMSVNSSLDHTPPDSWTCYTDDAYAGASSANLALGAYGTGAIHLYMKDHGDSNGAVGHRRWLLYPQTQNMGTGDIPFTDGHYASNALVVFDSHMWEDRPDTRHEFVAWPPPGYVPAPIVYARWSFSYPDADFSSASVSMTKNGATVAPIILEEIHNGYGENTLVWRPYDYSSGTAWPCPTSDETYQVTVKNVKINGVARNFSYTVIVFAP